MDKIIIIILSLMVVVLFTLYSIQSKYEVKTKEDDGITLVRLGVPMSEDEFSNGYTLLTVCYLDERYDAKFELPKLSLKESIVEPHLNTINGHRDGKSFEITLTFRIELELLKNSRYIYLNSNGNDYELCNLLEIQGVLRFLETDHILTSGAVFEMPLQQ